MICLSIAGEKGAGLKDERVFAIVFKETINSFEDNR
jgi:hypothetical protein